MSIYENINDSKTSNPQDYLKGPFLNGIYGSSTPIKFGSAEYLMSRLLTEEEMEVNFSSLDKDALIIWQILPEDFIIRHIVDLNPLLLTKYQVLSENTIKSFLYGYIVINKEYFYALLHNILRYQSLNTEFILEYLEIIIDSKLIHILCKYQELDRIVIEKLLSDFKDSSSYSIICRFISHYQELTTDIVDNYPVLINNPICKKNLYVHQALPKAYYSSKGIPICNASINTIKEWKRLIADTLRFEISSDYFYAYKIIRADYYSIYNYNYKFDVNNESYYTFSDYSYDEHSFGFEASTFKGMLLFKSRVLNNSPKFKIIKVKIYYKDLTYVGEFDNKFEDALVRCNTLEIVDFDEKELKVIDKINDRIGKDFNLIYDIPEKKCNHKCNCYNRKSIYGDVSLRLVDIDPTMIDFYS